MLGVCGTWLLDIARSCVSISGHWEEERATFCTPQGRVVRRTYNYRTQVVLAVFMMCFAALALTAVDAINPE